MSNPIVPGYDIVNKIGSGSYSNVYKGFKQVCITIIITKKCYAMHSNLPNLISN